MAVLIVGRPQQSTNSERIAKGIQARKTCPVVWVIGVSVAAARSTFHLSPMVSRTLVSWTAFALEPRSSENRQMRFGRQNRRKSTVTTSEKIPAAISTRLLSTWLDQKYCIPAKDNPTTRIAGSTSKVSSQLTIVFTSQKGTMIAVNGKIRPIILLRSPSGRAETNARVCTGVPIAPHATGAVLDSKFRTAA